MHATLPAREDGSFHILQVTDLHSDADTAATARTYDDIRRMIEHVRPDLLAVTGDIWCSDEDPERAADVMEADLRAIGQLGVPWSFCWGNHDYFDDFDAAMESIANAPLAVVPGGDGKGNHRIEVRDPNTMDVLWDIFFLNSRTECLLPEDVAWYESKSTALHNQRGRIVPAVLFFHIPLKQYETARLEHRYKGVAYEEVLYWGDDGTRFATIARPGNARACFVGHSHANDFYTEEDGVILAYGRATGHGGYGGELLRKGGKRIVLDGTTGQLKFETIFPDGSTWRPD